MIVLRQNSAYGLLTVIFLFYSTVEVEITESIRNADLYTRILRNEIVLASGYTEPISVAYCAAKAHQILGMQPTSVTVSVSDLILKSLKGVVIPNTNGLTGIRAAIAAGIICGDVDKEMQVIGSVSEEQRSAVADFMSSINIDVSCAETDCPLYISMTLYARTSYSRVVIADGYFNIVEIMKNGDVLFKRPIAAQNDAESDDASCLNLHDIFEYAKGIEIAGVLDLLTMQIDCNMAICEEGLNRHFGADFGKVFLHKDRSDIAGLAKAYAVSGCEARMNGCELPVAILCGSGNQGITATVPVICYAKHYTIDRERLYRALILSDLLTIYLSTNRGRFSSYCGAMNAGCAAGASIAYLSGEDEDAVIQTFNNAISMMTDMKCDGAKPSCAAKIAAAIDTGVLGYHMVLRNR